MAGDWIKMRSDLFTHPKVVRMASALKADRLRVVGGLMSVWCLFDAHSADGKIEGYDFGTVDELLNWPGFATSMSAVNWLAQDGESLVLPDFDKHNGQSAKRRAQDADRKRDVRKASASNADKVRTREEKRREEKRKSMARLRRRPLSNSFPMAMAASRPSSVGRDCRTTGSRPTRTWSGRAPSAPTWTCARSWRRSATTGVPSPALTR